MSYPCWCDGAGCDNEVDVLYDLCAQCKQYHHGRAPKADPGLEAWLHEDHAATPSGSPASPAPSHEETRDG